MTSILSDTNTSQKIRGLLASRGKHQTDLAVLLDLTPSTISSRMARNEWTVKELQIVAEHFGVQTSDLI